MSNLLKSKFLLGVMVVAVMFVGFAFNAGTASADCSITMTLRVGSHGAEVMCLQTIVGATADGSFGPKTKAAVMAFQASHSLVADGIVGPITRASLMANGSMSGNFPAGCQSASGYSMTTGMKCDSSMANTFPAGCMSASGYSPTTGMKCDGSTGSGSTGPLTGGAGDITDVTLLGTPNAEQVGEGETAHKVVGFEVQADNGSDIALTSVKVEFDRLFGTEQSGSSTHINDYISGVSIWQGTKKVGSANIDDFTKTATGVYSKSISLTGAVVKRDKTERFYVAVDGNDTVDSTDMLEQMGVEVTSIRFTDATGAILTNTPASGDIQQYFTIQSQADASNAKLTFTEASDNPNAGVIQVDDQTQTTDNVPLLKFKLKATGSDLWIDELPVLFTTTATNVTDDTASVTLTIDGQDFSEATSPQDDCSSDDVCTVTFDKLDFTLHEGDSVDVSVTADINGVGSALNSGDSLKADITSTERNAAVVEVGGEEGDDLGTSSTDRVGTVSGEYQGFYNQGITVNPGSTMKLESIAVDSAADTSQATITFKVTAIGEDVYLEKAIASSTSTSSTPTDSNRAVIVNNSGTALTLTGKAIAASDNNSDEKTNTFKIPNGQTASFTMTLNATGTNAQVRGILYGLEWTTSDSATATGVYTLDMGVDGSYKTPYQFVSSS